MKRQSEFSFTTDNYQITMKGFYNVPWFMISTVAKMEKVLEHLGGMGWFTEQYRAALIDAAVKRFNLNIA